MRVGVNLPGPFWVSFPVGRRRGRYRRAGRRHGLAWWLLVGWWLVPIWATYRWVYWPLMVAALAVVWLAACGVVLAARRLHRRG